MKNQTRNQIQNQMHVQIEDRMKDQKSEMRELKNWRLLLVEEDGMGTVEIILIIVVLVGLVLIFKDQITAIVESIFSKITRQTNKF